MSMIVRSLRPDERIESDLVAQHPLQTWSWGEFRQSTGQKVERLGVFSEQGKLQAVWQVIFSKLPIGEFTVGYIPRGPEPTEDIFPALRDLGQHYNALFIKLEPNLFALEGQENPFQETMKLFEQENMQPGKPLFTPYTFVLDLTKTEEEIFNNCKSKTRYNIRLAKRKGVEIIEDTSQQGLEDYLRLLQETTSRQKFYAHDDQYFRNLFAQFAGTKTIRILKATYEGKVITAWILFLHNGVGYYPYGASSRDHRDVMANNLMMWEALMLAKREGCTKFDMWGSLGPNPDEKHKWYGFHRFKEGYSGDLMQSIGSYDLVLNFPLYSLFRIADQIRWAYLRLKAQI